jgi:hypothetical protein
MEFRLKLFSWRATLSDDSGSWPFFSPRFQGANLCRGVTDPEVVFLRRQTINRIRTFGALIIIHFSQYTSFQSSSAGAVLIKLL